MFFIRLNIVITSFFLVKLCITQMSIIAGCQVIRMNWLLSKLQVHTIRRRRLLPHCYRIRRRRRRRLRSPLLHSRGRPHHRHHQ